jgi:hypothetical protein
MATYVLVHGRLPGGWIWKPVGTRLRAAATTSSTKHAQRFERQRGTPAHHASRHHQAQNAIGQEIAQIPTFSEDLR